MGKTKIPQVVQNKELKPNLEQQSVDEPQLARILNSLPSSDRSILMAAIKQESFSGPLPHPQYYEGYEKVLPGSANRILTMTESQMGHRIKQEDRIVRRSLNQKLLGIIIGGLAVFFMTGAAVYLGINNHDGLAGVIGTTTILGVISVFVLGVRPGSKEKEEGK